MSVWRISAEKSVEMGSTKTSIGRGRTEERTEETERMGFRVAGSDGKELDLDGRGGIREEGEW